MSMLDLGIIQLLITDLIMVPTTDLTVGHRHTITITAGPGSIQDLTVLIGTNFKVTEGNCMKKLIVACVTLGCVAFGFIVSDIGSASIEDYSTDRRPFSWYYPYNYKYYYPRPQYEGSRAHGGYWIYSNGTYLYRGY